MLPKGAEPLHERVSFSVEALVDVLQTSAGDRLDANQCAADDHRATPKKMATSRPIAAAQSSAIRSLRFTAKSC